MWRGEWSGRHNHIVVLTEAAHYFRYDADVDTSFDRLIDVLIFGLNSWPDFESNRDRQTLKRGRGRSGNRVFILFTFQPLVVASRPGQPASEHRRSTGRRLHAESLRHPV